MSNNKDDSSSSNPRHDAMVEFLGKFSTLSGSPPTCLEELSDGVALFEALSEIAPDYFDPTTIARHLGDNWALKSSNWRKLLRHFESYAQHELKKTVDWESLHVSEIARNQSTQEISKLVVWLVGAAVSCESKQTFVGYMMQLSLASQAQLKDIVQESLTTQWKDYETNEKESDCEDEAAEVVFDSDDDDEEEDVGRARLFENNTSTFELEQSLTDLRREFAQFKSTTALAQSDKDASLSKLQSVVQDLQDRLVQRQDELIACEEALSSKTSALESLQSQFATLQHQHAQVQDELDVAHGKAQRLQKAESTVSAYRNKLEGVGVMNDQMEQLQQQSQDYLRQIMELEFQLEKVPALQTSLRDSQQELEKMQARETQLQDTVQSLQQELAECQAQHQAAQQAKKLYQDELMQLKQQNDHEHDDDLNVAVSGLNLTTTTDSEKVQRLEIQNQQLKQELTQLRKNTNDNNNNDNTDNADLVSSLRQSLQDTQESRDKLQSDKEKLEAYTKRTLAKFQEKYLVALQECKAKLKEKQDKIEVLEGRSASEKTAQKREERLLSSTIYELGLAMMQHQLKHATTK